MPIRYGPELDHDPFADAPPSGNVENRIGESPEQMNQEIGQGMVDDFRAMRERRSGANLQGPEMAQLFNYNAGLSDLAAQQRQMTHQPPDEAQERVGRGIRTAGGMAWKAATAFPRAAKRFTEEALTNVPGQDPRYLSSTIGKAADVGLTMPFTAAGAETALGSIAQRVIPRGTDIGMYKLVPTAEWEPPWREGLPGRQNYKLLGHEDEPVMDLPNVKYDPKTKHIKLDAYSSRPYRWNTNEATNLNRGAWSLLPEDKIGINRALLREFPEAETAEGGRVSGVRSRFPPGDPRRNQPLPLRYWVNPEDAFREAEELPKFPELEKSLFEAAMENIRNRPPPPADAGREWMRGLAPPPPIPARQRAGLLPRNDVVNQEMSSVRQEPSGMYSVIGPNGAIMAQGMSTSEAIANAELLGFIRPPINTRAHERVFGIGRTAPPPPDPQTAPLTPERLRNTLQHLETPGNELARRYGPDTTANIIRMIRERLAREEP